jgi:hypothetical protein
LCSQKGPSSGERKLLEMYGGEPASPECYCMKLKCDRNRLIINEILVEATGVELFSVLTARKLLILRIARRAKKAPLPVPLYVYCTKNPFASRLVKSLPRAEYPTIFAP